MKQEKSWKGVACFLILLAVFCVMNSAAQDVAVSLDESSKIIGIFVADEQIGRYLASPGDWEPRFRRRRSDRMGLFHFLVFRKPVFRLHQNRRAPLL